MVASKETNNGLNLDDVLEEIGTFGKFQWVTIILVLFPMIFSAYPSTEYVFAASKISTRCLIPQCESADDWEFQPPWLSVALPEAKTGYDQCKRYAPLINSSVCAATSFNTSDIIPCDAYVYERTNSLVYDFHLECKEWLRVLIGTFSSIGTLLVLPFTGYISDHYGRRVAFTINAINTAVFALIRAGSVNYEMYLLLHLIGTTLGAGTFSAGYILATELVGRKWRALAGCLTQIFFALGQVIYAFMAWGIAPWRITILVAYAPQLFVIAYFWIIPESVRWLLIKGRFRQGESILSKAAKINGKELSKKSLNALAESARREITSEEEKKKRASLFKEPLLITIIFRSPVMLRRMCTLPIWWITATLVYYGMSINAVGLSGNMYLNFIAVSLIEIPGYLLAYFGANRIGRNKTLGSAYFTCAVCSFIFPFVSSDMAWLSMTLYLTGKCAISAVFSGVYVYTAELLPTIHRHSLMAFASMVGRIGSITAPLTPALMIHWSGIPSVIFGVAALISGCLVLTQPETLGITLPDTIEEAELIGRKTYK